MNKKTRNILIAIVAALVIGSLAFMLILSSKNSDSSIEMKNSEMPEATGTTEELVKGLVVEQNFINKVDNINEIAVVFSRIYYLEAADAEHTVAIELLDGNNVLASTVIKSNDIPDQHRVYLYPDSPISNMVGKELTLKIYENSKCDTGVSLMMSENAKGKYYFGSEKKKGSICFSITGE